MGCKSSKSDVAKGSSNNEDTTDKLAATVNKTVLKELHRAKGSYNFEASLNDDVLETIPDNETIVEQKNIGYKNGATYTGYMKGRKRHGKGVFIFSDEAQYDGEWVDDVACGFGIFQKKDEDTKIVYEGEWKNNVAHGNGKLFQKNIVVYEGNWLNDVAEGKGAETWPDGSKFEGYYKNGLKEGRGLFEWPEKSKYNGEFHLNELEGWGRYDWPDGRIYCGQWTDNKMHGFGWFFWPNGQIYRGQYDMDKKEGYGEFLWPDGKIYSGSWEKGKQSGYGIFKSPKGEERYGIWENGYRLNWITASEYESKVSEGVIPPKPQLPSLPDWLETLCKEAYPSWYQTFNEGK